MGLTKMGIYLRVAFIVIFGALLTCAVPLENKSLSGHKKCDAGPAVWCSNLRYAKNCNAVNYCIENVWSNKLLKNDESISCTECNAMVARTRFLLSEGQDVKNMYDLVRFECSRVSIADAREKCNLLAENLLSEFDQLLASNMNEAQTCAALGFCRDLRNNNPKSRDFELEGPKTEELAYEESGMVLNIHNNEFLQTLEYEVSAPEIAVNSNVTLPFTCTPCKLIVRAVQKLITVTISKDRITSLLSLGCSLLPSLQERCQSIIKTSVSWMYDVLVEKSTGKTACKLILMCNIFDDSEVEELLTDEIDDMAAPTIGSNMPGLPICGACKALLNRSQALIKAFVSKDEIVRTMEAGCNLLVIKSAKQKCHEVVRKYARKLADFIYDPNYSKVICGTVRLCRAEDQQLEELIVDETDDMSAPLSGPNMPGQPTCETCKLVISSSQFVIKSVLSKDEIVRTMAFGCDLLPVKGAREKCYKEVGKYGRKFADLIYNQNCSQIICGAVRMCRAENWQLEEIGSNIRGLPLCETCKRFTMAIQNTIKTLTPKGSIMAAMVFGCSLLPNKASDMCYGAVIKYGRKVTDFIYDQNSVQVVCHFGGLCRAGNQKVEVDTNDCNVCLGASTNLLLYIKQNQGLLESEQSIISVACARMPTHYFKTCTDLISNYGRTILDLAVKDGSYESFICSSIGKCLAE